MTVESSQEVSKKIKIFFCLALASVSIGLIYNLLLSIGAIMYTMGGWASVNIVMDVLLICGYLGILLSKKLRIWGAVVFGLSILALVVWIIFFTIALISPLLAQRYAPIFEVIGTLPALILLIRLWPRGISLKILLILVLVSLCLYIVYDIWVYLMASGAISWETFDSLYLSLNAILLPLSYALRVLWILFWLVLIMRPSRILTD